MTKITRSTRAVRALATLAVLAVALLCSGCALVNGRGPIPKNVSETDLSNGNEPYFNVDGLTMQIQSSRALNAYSSDVTYFSGLKSAQSIPADDFWYGIFIWAKNQNKKPMQSPTYNDFVLTDSDGNSYSPTQLDPNLNPWMWTSMTLEQNDIEPASGTIPGDGPAGGSLLLFLLPDTVYQNRPLTLHVYPYGDKQPGAASAISLDL